MKMLIIGNSAAGTAAIEGIRAHDTKSSILQLTDEIHPLYSRCLISYYLAGKIDKTILSFREANFHRRMGVELKPRTYVSEVEPVAQRVRCSDGSTYPFDRLLIATGSSAKIPDTIPGDLKGVFVLRTIADAELIKQRALLAKSAVILGGGLVGMRAADALSQCGLKVKVIVGSNRVLSRMIDFDAAQIILKKLEKNSIEVMTGTDAVEVMQKGGEVIGIKTDQGQSLDCEILVVAKSVRANIDLITHTDIKTRWGIESDLFMQTSHANIFAAGDVAVTIDLTTEYHTVNALWTCAVQQGRVAGENIVGKGKQYAGSVAMNSLNFWSIPLISFIQNKIDVSSFKEDLLSDHFNFGKVIHHGSKSVFEKYYKGCSYV
jgi:nitrite reductase (NADH) large subunit